MKKIILILAVMLGMVAMSSCTSCNKTATDPVNLTEFVYDVTASAAGEGKFAWEVLPHTGDVALKGELVVNATNDTTSAKVFTDVAVANAPTLAAGLESEDAAVKDAAVEVEKRLSTTHLEGDYKLSIKGYAKYGPMYFIIDEEYPKPAVVE